MTVESLEQSGLVLCKLLTGSRAYGTAIDVEDYHSDFDYRGVFRLPTSSRITIGQVPTEVGQEKPEDIKYYELSKFMLLAKDCNPNIIEFFFVPEDCVKVTSDLWKMLLFNRHLFVTQKAYHTFSGYAYAQIKKMRGQNKFVNNPQPKERPVKDDFCWVIPNSDLVRPGFRAVHDRTGKL